MRNGAWIVALALVSLSIVSTPVSAQESPPPSVGAGAAPSGRFEADAMFAFTFLNQADPNHHVGVMLDVSYTVLPTLAVGASIGYLDGGLTDLADAEEGTIGNMVTKCIADATACADITPRPPANRQMTGIVDLLLSWAPGRLDALDAYDSSLELVFLAGGGLNLRHPLILRVRTDRLERAPWSTFGISRPI